MSLRLTSIALVGRARFCVIDGRSLREGEFAGGFTVRQIAKDHVVVERNGRQFELRPQPVARIPEPGGWGDRGDDGDGRGLGGPGGGSRFPGGPARDASRGVDPFDSGYGNDGPPLPPPGGGGPGGSGGGGGPGGRPGPGGRR
jgi:Type II secretion system protein B